MKSAFSTLLIFVCLYANGQNKLSDLYTVTDDKFPQNLPHVKQWINKTLGGVFVRNLQYSDNVKSASKFLSFTPVLRAGVLPLFNAGGLQLKIPKGDLRMQYDQEILNYLPFDITTFDYSLKSYFMLSTRVLKLTPEQMIANTLNLMIEGDDKKSQYQLFFDQVNKKQKAKVAYPKEETVKEAARLLQQQYPDKIYDIIFDTYIRGKNDQETTARMQKFYTIAGFFRGPVIARLDEMISPAIQFRHTLPQDINLARVLGKSSGIAADTTTVFQSTYGVAVLSYKEKSLEITFNGKLNHPANLMFTKLLDYQVAGNKPKLVTPGSARGQNVDLRQIVLQVTESGVVVWGVTNEQQRFEVLNKKWE